MIISTVILLMVIYLQQPKFGRLPNKMAKLRFNQSPHYRNGKFHNLQPTPVLTYRNNQAIPTTINSPSTAKKQKTRPKRSIPSVKIDFQALDNTQDLIIWLGHSSYYIQLAGKRILIDPVFSLYASPVPFFIKAYAGTRHYQPEDLPDIDYLLITHDHWDHLDYPTVKKLRSRVDKVICGLGVGSHLIRWGYHHRKIYETDWFTTLNLDEELTVHTLPARHFSGRFLSRNKTLWVSFALETNKRRLFISGDGGYGSHFAQIGQQFNGFDLAILENGQYDRRWAHIHMQPEQVAQAAVDLQAKAILPAHVAKYTLANHAWDEPFIRLSQVSKKQTYQLVTPMIGEIVKLSDRQRHFSPWWQSIV